MSIKKLPAKKSLTGNLIASGLKMMLTFESSYNQLSF